MAATTKDRSILTKKVRASSLPVAAATLIPLGVLVARNAAGYAVNAADAAGLRVVGFSDADTADNAAGLAGDIQIEFTSGIAGLFENDGANPVLAAHVGDLCYVLDNQTVSSDPGDHGVVAGVVESVVAGGVYVIPLPEIAGALAAAKSYTDAEIGALD